MNISLFLYWIFCLQVLHLNFIDSVGASKYCFNCYNQPFIVVISSISSDPARGKLLQTASPELVWNRMFECVMVRCLNFLGNIWLIYILTLKIWRPYEIQQWEIWDLQKCDTDWLRSKLTWDNISVAYSVLWHLFDNIAA